MAFSNGLQKGLHIYMVTMEYAGIAEAGGVKLVARSLCEELSRLGYGVTVITPRFGCTDMTHLTCVQEGADEAAFMINGKEEKVSFTRAVIPACAPLSAMLVSSSHFAEKEAVYTYTEGEEEKCPAHKKGMGHEDAKLLNTLLCKAAAFIIAKEALGRSGGEASRSKCVVLCEDAPAALTSVYLAALGALNAARCIVTIHNAAPAYHHEFASLDEAQRYTGLPSEMLCGAFNGQAVEPFLLAAGSAVMTTVSKEYAAELLSAKGDEMTQGLSSAFRTRGVTVTGILNGIDYDRYDPAGEASLLPYKFDASKGDFAGKAKCREYVLNKYFGTSGEGALFCFHGRIVRQKGIDVLCKATRMVFQQKRFGSVLFIAMGQGEDALEEMLSSLAKDYSAQAVYIKGYDKALSRLVIASSDFIIVPSITEPCGQEDYIAQIYGTLPIAHATGGLQKIQNGKTGFLYKPNTPERLADAVCHAADKKEREGEGLDKMRMAAAKDVKENHSWHKAVKEGYLPLFGDGGA